MSDKQLQDYRYFLKSHSRFLKKYRGKYVVIKNKRVIGSYKDLVEAVEKTKQKEEPGSFIVQLVDVDSNKPINMFPARMRI